jgi:2-polyprenyl-3-methyl-5-hydroxy-6-metoxy-1,4-benzoquinol methylase
VNDWYSALTVDNPVAIKRFSHRRRFQRAIYLLEIAPSDRVLDCGAGDGFLVRALASFHCAELVAFEPAVDRFDDLAASLATIPAIRVVSSTAALPPNSYDKIACLEVFEHLTDEQQDEVMSTIDRLLAPRGIAVISVPVETGPASLLKNLVRIAIRQTHADTTAANVARSLLGLHIKRRSYTGHIGFDHRRLPPLFAKHGFAIVKRASSPFAWGGVPLSTQLFFVINRLAV